MTGTRLKTTPDPVTYAVEPGGILQGSLQVPGDKSISHRAIMFGSIANGTTEVQGFLEGEDALHTLAAFAQMGVSIEHAGSGHVIVHGQGHAALKPPGEDIYLGNSGTGLRLLTGMLAGLRLPVVLVGDASLNERPMRRIVDPLALMGASVTTSDNGTPPLRIHGGGQLTAIEFTSPLASAQVKSCVLLAGLFARGQTIVHEPAITRDHTEKMLSGFGVNVGVSGLRSSLLGGQSLTATSITVPGDISSAAFFLVGASMVPGSELLLTGVGMNPTRTGVIDILRLMGARIAVENRRESGGEPVADLRVNGTRLCGIKVPENLVSLAIDEFPALFIAAAAAEGETVITGAEELRVKETDRIQVMTDGLRNLGVEIIDTPDGALIRGGRVGGGTVDSAGDHRTAMAFSMAGLVASETINVLNCANVDTSFPGFLHLAASAGLRITQPVGQ